MLIAPQKRNLRATPKVAVAARAAVLADVRSAATRAIRLVLPLLLLLFLAFGQVASAHEVGNHHKPHATGTMSHHAAEADIACCNDLSRDADGRACLAQCLAACGYCAPLPPRTALPDMAAISPLPATTEPLRGAIASPYLRPPWTS